MNIRPDPTFYPSPKLAMEAPVENFAYALMLSPDRSKPDALAVVDVKAGSKSYGKIVHTVTMPNRNSGIKSKPYQSGVSQEPSRHPSIVVSHTNPHNG